MQYAKSVLFTILIFFSAAGFAADAFENGVPHVLVEQFTSGQISEGLPDTFPALDVPDGLNVLGSLNNDFNTVSVFSTALSADEATQLFVQELMRGGWVQLLSMDTMDQPMTGFIFPNPMRSSFIPDQQYCHDAFGTLSMFFTEADSGPNMLKATLNNQSMMQPGFSCQQQNAQREMQMERRGGPGFGMLNSMYMPRLVMPENEADTPIRRAPFFGGFSGSSDDFETNASYRGDLSAEALYEHFAEQLEEQNWMVDSQWAGDVTAGGNWTSSPAPNQNFLGILSIMERSDDVFELKFRLVTRNSPAGGAAIRGIGVIRDVVVP